MSPPQLQAPLHPSSGDRVWMHRGHSPLQAAEILLLKLVVHTVAALLCKLP